MNNKELKKELFEKGKYKEYTSFRSQKIKEGIYNKELEQELEDNFDNAQELEEMRRAIKEQKKKIKKHLDFWVRNKYTVIFATYTISPEKREKMWKCKNYYNNFKKQVIRTLNVADDYILNIDYGSINEREHFHCLIAFKQYNKTKIEKSEHKGQVEIKDISDKYHLGFLTFEKCGFEKKDIECLSAYMNKLVNHSSKVKQTYISTKKGSQYQEYKHVIDVVYTKAPMRTASQNNRINNYIKEGRLLTLFKGNIKIENKNVLNIAPYQVRGNKREQQQEMLS